jgi:sulfur-oxidizing protein SoxZ
MPGTSRVPNGLPGSIPGIGESRILIPAEVHRNDVIDVRALLSHPMDTGFFRDAEGHPIPPHFVNAVTVTYGAQQVARFEWTSGISRDPYVSFPLLATHEGPIRIVWKDNAGATFEQSVNVKFV